MGTLVDWPLACLLDDRKSEARLFSLLDASRAVEVDVAKLFFCLN